MFLGRPDLLLKPFFFCAGGPQDSFPLSRVGGSALRGLGFLARYNRLTRSIAVRVIPARSSYISLLTATAVVVDHVAQIYLCVYVYIRGAHVRSFIFSVVLCVNEKRLVNALDDTSGRERTWFVIHIDTKAEDMQKEMLEAFMDRPNVIVMEEGRCVCVCVCVFCPSVLHARVDNAACWSPPRSNLYASYRYIDYATCIPVALKRCCRLVLLCVTAVDSLVPRSFRPRSRPKKHSSTQAGRGLGRLQRGPGFAQRGGRRAGEADPVPLAVDPERDDVPDRVQ